MTEHI